MDRFSAPPGVQPNQVFRFPPGTFAAFGLPVFEANQTRDVKSFKAGRMSWDWFAALGQSRSLNPQHAWLSSEALGNQKEAERVAAGGPLKWAHLVLRWVDFAAFAGRTERQQSWLLQNTNTMGVQFPREKSLDCWVPKGNILKTEWLGSDLSEKSPIESVSLKHVFGIGRPSPLMQTRPICLDRHESFKVLPS